MWVYKYNTIPSSCPLLSTLFHPSKWKFKHMAGQLTSPYITSERENAFFNDQLWNASVSIGIGLSQQA